MSQNPTVAPDAPTLPSPWPTFAVCAVASYITTLDLSVVNVAFAEIAKSFPNESRAQISWVVTAYSILFGALLVVAGRLADRLGRKRVFTVGTALFLVGSFLCGIAPGMAVLIVGRAVQGIGGALLTPASTGLLLAAFPVERRTQVIAWVGGIGALGVASGPTIGALLVATFGWRSAFWINLPICAFALLYGRRVLLESERQEGPLPDIAGAVMVTLAVAAAVLGISQGEEWGWGSTRVLGLFATTLVLGLGVVLRSRTHPEPMLPPALFRERTFTVANCSSFVFGAGFSGMQLSNVLFLRTVWHYGVVKAGLFSVLSPVVVAIVSMYSGRQAQRHGFRLLLIGGPTLFALVELGFASLMHTTPTPWTRWIPMGFLLGTSIGLTFPTLSAAAVFRLPPARFALGSALNNTFRQVGSAVGVATVVAIQSTAAGATGFHRAWLFSAGAALAATAISLLQPSGATR